ncbi:MAG: ribonuclease J [Bifidobacteriaceae bacterium]|jgi:ribonuclease J|nr:ribonuclease J [Bifidobacteriaceae bacterium]
MKDEKKVPQIAPLAKNAMRIVPLGGLGAVGRNMHTVEYDGKILIIDCGVLFPAESQPGVDLILPDFSYILPRINDVEAIILTHGHEDHIGAVPYLLMHRPDIPIIGSRFTLALIDNKLKQFKIDNPTFIEVQDSQTLTNGDITLKFVAVSHSIPDALAVAIKTPAGTILNTGDIKLDQTPLDGRVTDLNELAALGDEGVDLFMVDSTNAEQKGFVRTEKEIGPVLDSLFRLQKGKIIVAAFSSHVHRVQQVINSALNHDRKVAFVGRSMMRNMNLASDLGYLHIPEGATVNAKKADDVAPDKIVLMCTGSQGEPMAALSRMARGDHQLLSVNPGDLIILASSLIPGNESSVYSVINDLTDLGANVVHNGVKPVHASGHACEGELLYLYNIVRPVNVMPIHGEARHLHRNAQIAQKTGVPVENTIVVKNGDIIDLQDHKVKVVGHTHVGLVFVDGNSIGELTETELTERRTLSAEGFVNLFAVVNTTDKTVTIAPELCLRGVAESAESFKPVIQDITKKLQKLLNDGATDELLFQKAAKRTLGTFVARKLQRAPMLVVTVKVTK